MVIAHFRDSSKTVVLESTRCVVYIVQFGCWLHRWLLSRKLINCQWTITAQKVDNFAETAGQISQGQILCLRETEHRVSSLGFLNSPFNSDQKFCADRTFYLYFDGRCGHSGHSATLASGWTSSVRLQGYISFKQSLQRLPLGRSKLYMSLQWE